MRILKLILMAALPALLTAACSSAPSTVHYYVLNPVATKAEATAKQRSMAVTVLLLRMPQYLDRPQIVTRSGDNELQFAEGDRWGGNLRKNMQQVVNGNLVQLLAASSLYVQPADSNVAPDLEVELEITRFERFDDGKVHLSANWQVVNRSSKVLSRHASDLAEPVAGSDYDRTVAAMSRLLATLSREIAEEVVALSGNEPAEAPADQGQLQE